MALNSDLLPPPKLGPRRRRGVPNPGESLAVEKPAIASVMDTETGAHLPVESVIGTDFDALMQLRMRVRTCMHADAPLYRCSLCCSPVHLCCQKQSTRFYFKHRHEDGNCPAITRGELSQDEIDARRYYGAKESTLHLRMKEWLAACLAIDGRFQDIEQEKTWKGALTGEWRRPDVRAVYQGIPIAFEIQLSTTYLNVIVERRQFYLQNGGLLFWVFALFDNEHRRMTEEDVFYNNNQNAFIIDAKTVEATKGQGRFMLECVWTEPTPGGGTSALHRKTVGFDELTLRPEKQLAYYFDYAGRKAALASAKESEAQSLRDEIEAWWGSGDPRGPDGHLQWARFATRLRRLGVQVPSEFRKVNKYAVIGLYSAKHNYPFGQGKKRLVEIAHHIASGYKHNLSWFMHAVKHYGRKESMEAEGDPAKWVEKRKDCVVAYKVDPKPFEPDRASQSLIEFLFPELKPLP